MQHFRDYEFETLLVTEIATTAKEGSPNHRQIYKGPSD
jgi:hypothetical protein